MYDFITLTESEYDEYDKMYRYICDEMLPSLWEQYGVMSGEKWFEEMTMAQSMREVFGKTLEDARLEVDQ